MVDVEVCAGGESTRRKMDALTDSAVEIVPSELYDSSRAKIAANLQWICAKAYGIDNIPEELKDPFYIDQYEQEHIKPPVIKLLLSSELYCRVCSLILKGDQVASLQGHQSVIQALSRKGIYVMESDDTPVSESDLGSAPIKMGSHMAMIDALMMAYTVEMISIEKVVASVKRFSTFSASKELPYDLEDAMVFWINKVNLKMREITEREFKLKQQLMESPGHQKSPSKWYWKLVPVRYRRDHPSNRQLPYFPMLEDLMKDGSDGAALLAVIHYYCPEQMKLDDICLKEVTSIADSLYNIQLLKEFSNEYLNKCFYLTLEDMLYAPLVLKPNVMVFIAELFWWFENVKPDFVQPRDIQEIKDAKTVLQQKSSRPPVPISNATKRSFMASPANTNSADLQPSIQLPPEACNRYYLHPEEAEYLGKGTPAFSPSHPLLPLRQKQQKSLQEEDSSGHRHRSNSLTRVDGQPRGSVLAWPEKKPRPLSQPTPFALHHSTSSEVDPGSGDSISLARSISKDSLASNIINLTPKHQPHAASVKTNGKSLLNNVEIEDEDEELVAIIRSDKTPSHGVPELPSTSSRAPTLAATTWSPKTQSEASESKTDSFYLEPLLPAVLKPAKEKQIINKVDECGEGKQRSFITKRLNEGHLPLSRKKASSSHGDHDLNRTFTPISSSDFTTVADPGTADSMTLSDAVLEISRPLATSSLDPSAQEQSFGGFFLHAAKSDEDIASKANVNYLKGINAHVPDTTWTMVRHDSDSDLLDIEDAEQDMVMVDDHPVVAKYIGEEESAKLQEDMKVKEHEDKDDASGRSSPCLSTISQISSVSLTSGSVRMTNFAERKLQRLNSYETKSSTSSSQKTTPDGSESCPAPLTTWKQKREQSPNRQHKDNVNVLASELVQLHMQLEEKRRAIEAQKKKMEALSARQRLKLGKAAFLHVVKKGKPVDVPQPLKPDHFPKEYSRHGGEDLDDVSLSSKSEEFLAKEEEREEMLIDSQEVTIVKMQENLAFAEQHKPKESAAIHEIEKSKIISAALLEDNVAEVDVNECDLSIEKLNETISTLQQAILKISQQQELLMKTPAVPSPSTRSNSQDQKVKPSIHFVEPLSPTGMSSLRKPPRFGQGRSPRSGRPADLKVAKERQQNATRIKTPTQSIETLPHLRSFPSNNLSRTPTETSFENSPDHGSVPQEKCFFDSYRLRDESNQRAFGLSASKDANIISEMSKDVSSDFNEAGFNSSDGSGKENVPVEEPLRSKANLIEVDLSDLKAPDDGDLESQGSSTDIISESDQKSGVGFFFKDEQKAEDELAKKRAAFLLKQQRKAEEARLRKQQLEAEVEQKRDEARRKAEEDRIRKEEEKARRELIKQEYLRKKQQQILEEQGLGKPKSKPKKPRPKSVHREESYSDSGTKCSSTPDNLSSAQSGSSLSLASAATTEPESVHSGGTPSQRVESMESLPILSRNPSRNTERDWENASTASSIASVAEYTGPKLFKEPSSKSNKPIIHNAISHCCLAGKVNEPHKNSILEELEKCDANHYIILFRDAGCQFRALYCYYPDTEEIYKLTGTGPKSITKKMIDKLYKYSSDRKQFNVIPAKTMSVSVDALTIHNHLWQAKRPAVPKKTQTRK
ncbi:calmodulin-regulated spectrin-associated protein 1 isoform X1 [Alligator sinensis]|uniref:Calmodulin-regulated spectrin-associated protein 1 isoform X1 n=1 Tax=Alligator sinensis TaxID=38654 RepID=A0A3Q0FU16_ALLSI|nr:calmodulin-regulated spectrin-associated protein 1 isoform X1 [Alligator sinensis]XP_025049640.1 calmodulin-regulated spectrin-associated protein 1 isoform X1 [Alligator sinensis]